MAENTPKDKVDGETPEEVTFTCPFCGRSRPISELTLQTRFFPVMAACRACEKAMQNIPLKN